MSIENMLIELTLQEIQNSILLSAVGFVIFVCLTIIGRVYGKKARNEFKKIVWFILTSLGAIGSVTCIILVLELTKLI